MKSDEALAAEQSLEAKLSAVGADEVRSSGFQSEPATAPDQGTPDVESDQPRDDQDRYTTTEEPPAETEPETEPTVEPVTEGDPAAALFLAKYGGDVDKALQGAAHLARKIGERDEKAKGYDELAAELEKVKAAQAQFEYQQQQQVQPQYVDQATVDWIDEQIAVNPGTAQSFAVQALQSGNAMLYERVMDTWFATQPRAAASFETQLRLEQAKDEMRAQQPAVQVDEGAQMQAALSNVISQHPEFGQYADDLGAVIQRYPAVAAGLRGDPNDKQQAIETLFALAERDTLRSLALNGGATPAEPVTTTNVATATTSTEHPDAAPAEPSPQELFRQQFRQEAERYGGDRPIPGAFVAR